VPLMDMPVPAVSAGKRLWHKVHTAFAVGSCAWVLPLFIVLTMLRMSAEPSRMRYLTVKESNFALVCAPAVVAAMAIIAISISLFMLLPW